MGTYADCISDFNANLPTDNSVSLAGSDAASSLHRNTQLWTLTELFRLQLDKCCRSEQQCNFILFVSFVFLKAISFQHTGWLPAV